MTSREPEATQVVDSARTRAASTTTETRQPKKARLHVVVRTPSAVVVDQALTSLRVPTASGQVGLRPRCEPCVLAIEAGLIVMHTASKTHFAGTAGGLLHTDGDSASLLTPLAVVGDDVQSVAGQLDALLSAPNEELEIRQTLGRLETSILQELQQPDDGAGRSRGNR